MSLHSWDLTPAEAIALQRRLAPRVVRSDRARGRVTRVAGVDVAFDEGGRVTRAAVVVLGLPGLETLEQAVATRPTVFPYVPGLLSFREVPAILDALSMLSKQPDVLLCDGQGYAHPRRFGLACHLGLLLEVPSVGVAKSRLIGSHAEPGAEKGAWVPLRAAEGGLPRRIGAVVRTRAGVKPLYVSVGHLVSLRSAIALTLRTTTRTRLPEPIRRADKLSKAP